MTLPAALFTHAAPYAAWEFWVHLLSGAAVVLGAAAALAWVVRFLWPAAARSGSHVARMLLFGALAIVAAALWVVGTPPDLLVRPHALAMDVAQSLAENADPHGHAAHVTAPAWADAAAKDLLADFGNFSTGAYLPPIPAGYRLALVVAPPLSSLSGLLDHGDSAPIPDLAHEVVGTLLNQIPVSTVSEVTAAGEAAVGAATGIAVTARTHTAVVLIAVFVHARG
jgi:hypothetical protein